MAWRYKIYNGDRLTDEGTSSVKPSIQIEPHPSWIVRKNEDGDVLSIEYQPPVIKIIYEEIIQTIKEDLV